MWKDFFYFRKANAELYFFVDFAFHIYVYMGSVSSKGRVFGTGSRGDRRNKNFLAGVHEMEEKESLRYSYDKPKRREVVLAAFDPNSADSIEFLQRGLPPFIAHTILQYRRAGGKFRTADDFSRVYGLSSEKFNMLNLISRYQRLFGGNRIHCTLSKGGERYVGGL